MNRIFPVVLFVVSACVNDQTEKVSDHFLITPKFNVTDTSTYVSLRCEFALIEDAGFVFDHDAISLESYNVEDKDLNNRISNLSMILQLIKRPQFVLENEHNERRFFYDITFFNGETYYSKDVFKLERTLDTVNLKKGDTAKIVSVFLDVNRFKIRQDDDSVKIYYLYKASPDERKLGFSDRVFQSNWINLSPR